MSMMKDSDHWAFLEYIEAPMWVDLMEEAKLSNIELDDEWFHRSHKFHHLPSKKLKAAFKHNIDNGGKLEIDIGGSSSPKIPSSVSKSRGKFYVNDKVGIDYCLSSSGEECLTNVGEGEALVLQCRNEMLPVSAREDSKLNVCHDQEGDGCGSAVPKLSSSLDVACENISSTNHLENNVGVSYLKSSITYGSMPGREREVASNCIIGRRSDLLSVMKQNLRKSCTTRMAVRGQIIDVQQKNDLRPSFGKSSVGSCSVHSQDAKNILAGGAQRTSRTPESKNVERPSRESKTRDKMKTSILCSGQYLNSSSVCIKTGDPLKTKAKPGKIDPRNTHNRGSSTISASLKIKTINRVTESDNRRKAGMPKNLKTSTAIKPAQCVNNDGCISKLKKSATVSTVPGHSSRQKPTTPKSRTTIISSKTSGSINEVDKSVAAKSSLSHVMTLKASLGHTRPLAPIHQKDQVSHRRPLAPVKQIIQGSSTFARKTMIKGKSDASTKPFCQGKENTVSNLVTSRRRRNGNKIDFGVMAVG